MFSNSGTLQWIVIHARLIAICLLLFAFSGCIQTTPDVKPTDQPSTTPSPATEPTPLPTLTSTAIDISPTATTSIESDLSFEAFPVTEGETIALVNGRVIDGTGAPAWLDWTVLIQGTRILAAGPDVVVPEGARRVDVTGQTLLPGMFDMHGHLYSYNGQRLSAEFITYPRLYLAGGVTTLFTAGDFDPRGAISLREAIRNNEAVGPQILTAGPYFSGGNTPSWMLTARTPEELRAFYEAWNDQIDGVKTYTGIPEDQFIALVEAAHADGLTVTGHLE